jgi:hypothetical protein
MSAGRWVDACEECGAVLAGPEGPPSPPPPLGLVSGPAPASAAPGAAGELIPRPPRRFSDRQHRLARVHLPAILADLAATPDPCPGRWIGSGEGEPVDPPALPGPGDPNSM